MKVAPPRTGRPREFDADKALDRALKVFWRKGFEGASLADLTKAMRINRPSLYAAFGNKESLFRKAVDRYQAQQACYFQKALDAPTARAAMEQLLQGTIDVLTKPGNPGGCLLVQGALCGDKDTEAIQKSLARQRAESEAAIRTRLRRAQNEDDLPADANPADLARYFATVMHGMSVQSSGGAKRADLLRVARLALLALPDARG